MALPDISDMEAYIRRAAAERGIDPDTAVAVARSEGLQEGTWQAKANLSYGRERSYGPFQLHIAPKGNRPGLGNEMIAETGVDPSDPKNWKQGIDFALNHAAKDGWGAWYGAKSIGVTGKMGIGGRKSKPTRGIAAGEAADDTSDDTDATDVATDTSDVDPLPDLEQTDDAQSFVGDIADAGDWGGAAESLGKMGQSMVNDAQQQQAAFDYTPAGENAPVDDSIEQGIPTNYYQQYMEEPQMYAQEGGEVDDAPPEFDPTQYEFGDEEMDPTEFFSSLRNGNGVPQ